MSNNKYGSNNSNVIELLAVKDVKDDKINHPYTKNKYGLVKFYAPWCPHCTDMIDNLEFLAKELPIIGKPFFVSAVNCTNKDFGNDKLAQNMGVKGFPTLFFVHMDGTIEDFTPQSRTLEGLLNEICNKTKMYNTNNTCCSYNNNKLTCN